MSWMQFLPVATSLFSAFGKSSAGDAAALAGAQQQEAARYEAAQARINAGQAIAASQRTAQEQRRQGELVQSRAIALAAAGGGSTTDPGIIHLLASNAGETAYRSAVALYEGEDKARSLREMAKAKEYSGAQAAAAGRDQQSALKIGAFGDLLKGGASLYSTFGGGGVGGDFQWNNGYNE
jgi:hypothetical protein